MTSLILVRILRESLDYDTLRDLKFETMKRLTRLIFLLGLLSSTVFSCDKDKEDNIPPVSPENKEFDLNNDSINDFKLDYVRYTWDGIGPDGTGFAIAGLLVPLNNNKILKNQDLGLLFYQDNDTLSNQFVLPYLWLSSSSEWPVLVEIKTYINQWENTWTIKGNETKDFYFLAFSISKSDKNFLGWMKLIIDKNTGLVEIVDKKTTDQEFIIIGKQ